METHSPREAEKAHLTAPDSGSELDLQPGAIPETLLQPQYSIAAVSKLTGISCHTLRVWERRYGFPAPFRTRAGHRRYDRVQVQTLLNLSQRARQGKEPISELIALLHEGNFEVSESPTPQLTTPIDDTITGLISLLVVGDNEGADREYARLTNRFDPLAMVEHVIYPGLVEAGEGWFRRNYQVYKERLITVFLRRKLCHLIDTARLANTQPTDSVIVGTVQGDRHEGGIMIFNLAMELRGWKVANLGVDLPVSEYRAAVQDLRASALALSFVLSRNIKKRFQELEQIALVPVFVGGRSIVNYQSLARHHGLIPLPGPIGKSAEHFVTEYKRLSRRHPFEM